MPFNKEVAETACNFFPKYLHHTKGRWGPRKGKLGERFELLPWQTELVSKLFGILKPDGSRQYNTVYCEIPKKSGKSELAAGIALKLLFADHEPGAEVYSAASDRDQASIVFNVAIEMIRQNKILASKCKIVQSSKRIIHENGSIYRVLSAEAYSKHGYNISGVMFDELHTQPNRDLWDVLTQGAGDARKQPIFFAISTAGFDRNSICWEVHEYARQVRDGIIKDPTFLPLLYYAPEEADWTSQKVWEGCNPSLSTLYDDGKGIIEINKVQEACQKAQDSPALENSFRRLRLNQWVKQENRYIPMTAWDKCGDPFLPEMLKGKACFAGLDLASSTDIAAFVLAFTEYDPKEISHQARYNIPPDPQELEKYIYILPYFWIPSESMEKRVRTDKVPYDEWVRQGFIKATEGNVISYADIQHDIIGLSKTFEIAQVAFDRWGAIEMSQNLTDDGFTMVDFGQGYKSMSPPTKDLLKVVLEGKIRHGDNPVLRWMIDNLVVGTDAAENVKPLKDKSTERIDGAVAMIMAIDGMARREPPSVYAGRGLLAVSGNDEDEWERKAQEEPEEPDQPGPEKPDIDAVHRQRYKSSED